MFIKKSWFSFYRDELPDWLCPTCGKASLNLVSEEFHAHFSSKTEKLKGHDQFDADWARYRFAAVLRCTNSRCNEAVTAVGSGGIETDHFHDEDTQWKVNYKDYFTPHFFEPSLKPISIPIKSPTEVQEVLNQAFYLMFSNYGAAANKIRVSIEILLDNHGVPKIENNKIISLGDRIQKHLTPPLDSYKTILSAVRWIGNAGSHESESIDVGDLLDGLNLVEHLLLNLYPNPLNGIDELAETINKAKKPRSQHK